MNDHEQLQAKFFEGDLGVAEAGDLARRLQGDESFATEFLSLYSVDQLLRVKFGPRQPDFARAVLEEIQRQESPFVRDVVRNIQCEPALVPRTRGRLRELLENFSLTPRWMFAAASVVLLLSLSLWYFSPTMGEPVLAEVKGADVSVERGTELIPALSGMRLYPADVLRIGTNASVAITFGKEPTRVDLASGTETKLVSLAYGKHLDLRAGKLEATVTRQRPFRPMVLSTPQAEARVLGTTFRLMATANATRLDVTEGKVKLTRTSDGAAVKVPAGNYAVAAVGYELAAQPLTGSILREYWTNLPGGRINDLLDDPSYSDRPNGRDYVDLLEVPAAGATNYGCRLAGYLHPPVTGQYIFWIAASPAAVVNLSKDENPANAFLLFGSGFDFGRGRESKPREWERKASFARTQSQPVTLVAGRRYYIEAIHKADDRVGHLAIAWTSPGGEREVIAGKYLSPLKPKPKEKKQ